ncbi:uncharacterized protein MELLADRAFT_108101 [Melampsora larici-populina 98AG31]|uniref:Helicase C-terminal domain-containing protein n=1 Tax=Melampsora larici-populina (strain 98AG31 / pathotype 3-4-7) TaxID=747676 RepID=F4RRZ4_MELLP|nr:uncharacterized protein MELLADRAFT_108101 [Melampsora larici-populina 98AG31]EGG04766.1 hypothetical protein MELLADRAFT_108101 [Melampsora larici-populina 98AG31]
MSEPLETAEDLLSIIPTETSVSDKKSPRMLIYSGTRDRTLEVMRAVCKARGNPDDIKKSVLVYIRRYRSSTDKEDKAERAREFGIVIIVASMDPSIPDLIGGRAGRNIDCRLVIHFVQPNMPNSPNTASEVVVSSTMNDEERMPAFRLTACCLRAVYYMDIDIARVLDSNHRQRALKKTDFDLYRHRYIPMSLTGPGYLEEMERQRTAGMTVCRCSNCDHQRAARVHPLAQDESS